jgi:membrane fusion protein (multidrug efflux system)
VQRAAVALLEGEIERRKIRAAVAGPLGYITVLRAGPYHAEGETIAAIVPAGELHVVAEFALAAIGRLRVGQPGRLRLAAYPWTEYGTVPVVVQRLGTEAHEGRVRVELAVSPVAGSPIGLQHGLPGSVLVEVEQVAPAILLLRAAGQLVGTRGEDPR